jgi:tetratricopeptide (TPR) repeat protein
LRRQWERDQDNLDTRLQYAIILSKSENIEDRREAVIHFEYLIYNNFSLRETLYHLTTLYYSVGDFESARRYSEDLYRLEPDSKQIKSLHQAVSYRHNEAINEARKDDQRTALTAAGVAVGVLSVGVGLALSLRKK